MVRSQGTEKFPWSTGYPLPPTNYFMLSLFKRRDNIGEVGRLFDGLVEALQNPISFCWDSSLDLRICAGVATGLQRPIWTLPSFIGGSHSYHVDDLLSWRMERFRRGSDQSKFQPVFRWIKSSGQWTPSALDFAPIWICVFDWCDAHWLIYLSSISDRFLDPSPGRDWYLFWIFLFWQTFSMVIPRIGRNSHWILLWMATDCDWILSFYRVF